MRLSVTKQKKEGDMGGSEHRNTVKKLPNTASLQEKSTKHRHRKSAMI